MRGLKNYAIQIVALLTVAIMHNGLSAFGQNVYLADSAYSYSWNSNINNWEKSWKETTKYNPAGKKTESVYKTWNASTSKWDDKWKTEYTYNTSNVLIITTYKLWTGSAWQSTHSVTHTFDNSLRPNGSVVKVWNASKNAWENLRQEVYVFDLNNRVKQYQIQEWDATGLKWVNSKIQTPVYENNGALDQFIYQIYENSGSLINSNRYEYTYNGEGSQTEWIIQTWNESSLQWQGDYKFNYTYYNKAQSGAHYKKYDESLAKWLNVSKDTFVYDNNGSLKEQVMSQYSQSASKWENTMRKVVYSSPKTISTSQNLSLETEMVKISVYPNPSTDFIQLENAMDESQVLIYNLSGVQVANRMLETGSDTIEINHLPAGTYIVRVMKDGQQQTLKFQKI